MSENSSLGAQFPVATYGITPQRELGAKPNARVSFGRNKHGLVTTVGAVSIAVLALTVGGPQVGYSGYSNAKHGLAEHRDANSDRINPVSPPPETPSLNTASVRSLPAGSASVSIHTEYLPDQLSAKSMPRRAAKLSDIPAANMTELPENGALPENKSRIGPPQALLESEPGFAISEPELTLPASNESAMLVDIEKAVFPDAETVRVAAADFGTGEISKATDRMIAIDPGDETELTANSSLPILELAASEIIAIDPSDVSPNAIAAEQGKAKGEEPTSRIAASQLNSLSSPVLPAGKDAADPTGNFSQRHVTKAARLPEDRAVKAQQDIGSALASLHDRLNGDTRSDISAPDASAQNAIANASMPLQHEYAASRFGEQPGNLAVTVANGELVSVRLDELISLFENNLEKPLFVWLKSSSETSKFVTPETLRNSGIEVEYNDETKQLVLSAGK